MSIKIPRPTEIAEVAAIEARPQRHHTFCSRRRKVFLLISSASFEEDVALEEAVPGETSECYHVSQK